MDTDAGLIQRAIADLIPKAIAAAAADLFFINTARFYFLPGTFPGRTI